jgi:signal transduction histidine kinase
MSFRKLDSVDRGAASAPSLKPVSGAPARCAFLVLLSEKFGDKVFPLAIDGPTTIGRGAGRHVQLPDPQVSSSHAEVVVRDGQWLIRDVGSKNGTLVNGASVTEHVLRPNDRIEIGGAATLFFTDKQFKADTGRRASVGGRTAELSAGTRALSDERGGTRAVPPSVFTLPSAPPPVPPEPGVASERGRSIRDSRGTIVVPQAEIVDALRPTRPARVEGGLEDRSIALLYQLAQALGAARSERDLLERALDLTLALIPADRAFAFLLDKDAPRGALPAPAVTRIRPGFPDDGAVVASTTIIEEVLRDRASVATGDAGADERFSGAESVLRNHIRAVMAAPIAHHGALLGVFYLEATAPGYSFSRSELLLLSAIAFHTGLALENARSVADLERRVADRAGEIERLSSERSHLLSIAAHDLKTPLAGILGYLECLVPRAASDPAAAAFAGDLSVVVEAAREMMDLLTDLLDRQRAEAGRLDFAPEPTHLEEFLGAALPIYERWAAGVGRRVELRLGATLPPVRLDRRRVSQILNNLVHNALKYTPRGTAVEIDVRADAAAGVVEISVTDHGRGFDGTDTDRILAQFVRGTKGEVEAVGEGHGLGLAIVKKLVELHSGVLEVDGRPGKGARFTVRLPVRGPSC